MPTISHKSLGDHLKTAAAEDGAAGSGLSPVTLVFGDAHLVRRAVQTLLNDLMPASLQRTRVETVDAATESIGDALERVNTYSLLGGPKVVVLANLQLSGSKSEKDRLVNQCSDACRKGDIPKAARYFLRLLGLLETTPAELARDTDGGSMPPTGDKEFDQTWRVSLCQYCLQHDLQVPKVSAETQMLQSVVEKGVPPGNYLVMTASGVDRRQQLFKSIQKKGTVVDCAVPQGDRHADKKAQETAVMEVVQAVCAENGKTMAPQAARRLYAKTGFELQTVVNGMEKLIAFVGQRTDIGVADVESVLKRTRRDPVYAFTNAIADRNIEDALFLLDELMTAGPGALRPEQVLVAMLNQIRRLLLAKEFVASPHGRQWRSDCPYPQFKQTVFPAVQAFDDELIEQLRHWDALRNPQPEAGPTAATAKKTKVRSDLILAANPQNPYPVFMLLKKSDNFRHEELTKSYQQLYDIDRRIKTGRDRKRLVLEQAVLSICRKHRPEE